MYNEMVEDDKIFIMSPRAVSVFIHVVLIVVVKAAASHTSTQDYSSGSPVELLNPETTFARKLKELVLEKEGNQVMREGIEELLVAKKSKKSSLVYRIPQNSRKDGRKVIDGAYLRVRVKEFFMLDTEEGLSKAALIFMERCANRNLEYRGCGRGASAKRHKAAD
ncbi:hypothetical protein BDP27DRAFT_1368162 [Rhodocollybia butyracea]|uniref:Uncharacterized protein n=1 Tax=Rhodocollybia butyracea TaxID=206335 RepID=A0A9P5PDM1_9AGAR|nr:hypothetical protein BDP27DRAFT_1368162 [Rhodocollybia butyracea]